MVLFDLTYTCTQTYKIGTGAGTGGAGTGMETGPETAARLREDGSELGNASHQDRSRVADRTLSFCMRYRLSRQEVTLAGNVVSCVRSGVCSVMLYRGVNRARRQEKENSDENGDGNGDGNEDKDGDRDGNGHGHGGREEGRRERVREPTK